MSQNTATRPGDITKFLITSPTGSKSIDFSAVVQDIFYYENVFNPSIEVKATIMETGLTDKKDIGPFGILDTLPVRGGEEVLLDMNDNQRVSNQLSFKKERALYVNKINNIDPGTQKDIYTIELCPKEHLANNQTRVVKRYDGKISSNVEKILTEKGGIQTQKPVYVDESAIPYNFIGNDKKPFYVCSWLAKKAIPALTVDGKSSIGGAAGYFFFENYDGYHFKSIDYILDGEPLKRYVITGKPDEVEGYDGKILSASIDRYIDLEQNLNFGIYANRSIFFDYYAMKYQVRDYNISKQIGKVKNAGKQDLGWIHEEFRKGPSRLMTHILDVGTLPSGENPKKQLEKWKENPEMPTFDAANTMVQSIMRYNQLFTIKTNVIIAGDFSLRAGDLIYCDFPTMTVEHNKEVNKETGGIYMIASLCHRITREDTYTSLTLVRDTFGRIPFKD